MSLPAPRGTPSTSSAAPNLSTPSSFEEAEAAPAGVGLTAFDAIRGIRNGARANFTFSRTVASTFAPCFASTTATMSFIGGSNGRIVISIASFNSSVEIFRPDRT